MIRIIIATTILITLITSCSSPNTDTVVVLDERKALNLNTKKPVEENNQNKSPINIFNDSKNTLKTISGKLMGIALNEEGEIFILDQETHKLLKFSPKGDLLAEFGCEGGEEDEFKEPKYIFIKGKNIYIADTWNNRIKVINNKGEVENFIYSSFFGPKGISIYNDKLYVADTGNHQIKVFNNNSDLIKTLGNKGSKKDELHEPTGLTHDNEGNLYIIDSRNNRICVYNNEDKFDSCWPVKAWGDDDSGKESWISYYNNKIYLSDPLNSSIKVFTKKGEELDPIIKDLSSISGITIKDNKIYAIDFASDEVIVKELNRK